MARLERASSATQYPQQFYTIYTLHRGDLRFSLRVRNCNWRNYGKGGRRVTEFYKSLCKLMSGLTYVLLIYKKEGEVGAREGKGGVVGAKEGEGQGEGEGGVAKTKVKKKKAHI